MRDFINIMETQGYFKPSRWNKSDFTYIFESGSRIEFFSADQPGKVRGPRRDRLFINEANNIPYETFDQLEVRTKEFIYLDWNPVSEFWFYDKVAYRSDCEHIVLTYKDNEGLDQRIINAIEQRRSRKGWWQVFGEGQLGEVEGKIYKDWAIIDEIPHHARYEGTGVDFGYSNDPTAIVDVYYYDGGYIWDEVAYQTGMLNSQIADVLLNRQNPQALAVADSAEPKSIEEIKQRGVNIMGVSKTKGETKSDTFVKWSIGVVQNQRMSLTKRSVNLIKEYRNYLWQVDKDGKILNEPEHEFSHGMDAGKYKMVQLLGKPIPKNVIASSPAIPFYGDREMPF